MVGASAHSVSLAVHYVVFRRKRIRLRLVYDWLQVPAAAATNRISRRLYDFSAPCRGNERGCTGQIIGVHCLLSIHSTRDVVVHLVTATTWRAGKYRAATGAKHAFPVRPGLCASNAICLVIIRIRHLDTGSRVVVCTTAHEARK